MAVLLTWVVESMAVLSPMVDDGEEVEADETWVEELLTIVDAASN